MNFLEARELARSGRHVRRFDWPADRWFSYVRGLWWLQQGPDRRVVRTGDYGSADLRAVDWTTIPRPLRACPIPRPPVDPPGTPSPNPNPPWIWISQGTGGDPFGPSHVPGGGPGPGPGPGPGVIVIPPAPPGGSITVTFNGLMYSVPDGEEDVELNGPRSVKRVGHNAWLDTFREGTKGNTHKPMLWGISVSRSGAAPHYYYSVHLFASERLPDEVASSMGGGFEGSGLGPTLYNTATGAISGGTATVR